MNLKDNKVLENTTITKFLDKEYKEYSLYVVENRAIPSLIDGFKPTQRKIVETMRRIWKSSENDKPMKVVSFAGEVMSKMAYHHGDCLEYNTEIQLIDGNCVKIGDWFTLNRFKKLEVVCIDEFGNKKIGIAHSPRIGQKSKEFYKIELETGEVINCTANHPFCVLTYNNKINWVVAEDLNDSMYLTSYKDINSFRDLELSKDNTMPSIKKITKILSEEFIDFYDISVDKYENFCITKNNIVVHNSSLTSAIVGMAQDFKNSLPLLTKIGQFGSMRSPDAGAPRYISVKPSQWFNKVYKDFELLEFLEEDGINVEPKYFLPIIPMILLNGTSGIAVGYSTDILNRNPLQILDLVLKVLENEEIESCNPWWKDFKGEIVKKEGLKSSYILKGKLEKVGNNLVKISELPPSMTFEKFEKLLNILIEKKIIVDYEDESVESPCYKIKFKKEDLNSKSIEELNKIFKLEESSTENITCLDENKNIKIYENPIQLIKDFVDFRLPFYQKRKNYLLKEMERKSNLLKDKIKFLNFVIEKKIEFNTNKKLLQLFLTDLGIIYIDECLAMPFSNLTIEEKSKLEKNLDLNEKEIKSLNKKSIKSLYLDDLLDLKKELLKEF